ncbi:MAG: alkaline phosphatase family protein, partial [Mycobacterium sp.]
MRWNGRSWVVRVLQGSVALCLLGVLVPRVIAAAAETPGDISAPAVGGADLHGHQRAGLSKLQHLVVMMQENRSYDSYFGYLPVFGQGNATLEPQTGNPDPTATSLQVVPFHQTATCTTADLAHGWTAVHQEIDGGRMDGFTTANVDPTDPTGSRALGYYTPRELPFYYALANAFGVGD